MFILPCLEPRQPCILAIGGLQRVDGPTLRLVIRDGLIQPSLQYGLLMLKAGDVSVLPVGVAPEHQEQSAEAAVQVGH